MSATLEKIWQEVSQLPEAEQDAIAELLAGELQWAKSLAQTPDLLEGLAEEALTEHRQGKTQTPDCG